MLGNLLSKLANAKNSTKFYDKINAQNPDGEKLAQAFIDLKNADIPCNQSNAELYNILRTYPHYADKISRAFIGLKNANIPYKKSNATLYYKAFYENNQLYKNLLADKLSQTFITLKNANIPYNKSNARLYEIIISNASYTEQFTQAFITLKKGNIPYNKSNTPIYNKVTQYTYYSDELSKLFVAFKSVNISYETDMSFWDSFTDDLNCTRKLVNILSVLNKLGFKYHRKPGYFNKILLRLNNELTLYVINALGEAGYSSIHSDLFEMLFTQLSNDPPSYQALLSSVNEVCEYAKNNSLLTRKDRGFKSQIEELTKIIDSNFSPFNRLTAGPLNKSEATVSIEILLEIIYQKNDINNFLIEFNEHGHYTLSIANQDKVNLSLLLKNANLSQLTLRDDLIIRLGVILEHLLGEKWKRKSDNENVLRFPEAQQIAIDIYIQEYYKDINRLFRSEPMDFKLKLNTDPKNHMLACFLIGCLLNDAAANMNHRLADIKASKATFLDRREKLTEENIKGRLANPWIFPALTSFSINKEGSKYFREENPTVTKLEDGTGIQCFVINHDEEEVIFPQGEQVITWQGPGYLLSKIVRSPSLAPKSYYASELALSCAFEHYLSKPYQDKQSEIDLAEKKIQRPNHGMAHTYRVMLNTEHVVNYFAHHAKDEAFKEFCSTLSDKDSEWLRIAAAFSITGRESEISAAEDLNRYDEYREASSKHFVDFIKKISSYCRDQARIERIAHIVRYMGNPNYEGTNKTPCINAHPDEGEREIRNYYHRILTIAHKLDLPRCYTAAAYYQSMALCRELSLPSEKQKSALDEMIRYNIQLTKAHGDRLSCDIKCNGEFFDVDQDYKDIFEQASLSIKRLFEITQTVAKPNQCALAKLMTDKKRDIEHDAKPPRKRARR